MFGCVEVLKPPLPHKALSSKAFHTLHSLQHCNVAWYPTILLLPSLIRPNKLNSTVLQLQLLAPRGAHYTLLFSKWPWIFKNIQVQRDLLGLFNTIHQIFQSACQVCAYEEAAAKQHMEHLSVWLLHNPPFLRRAIMTATVALISLHPASNKVFDIIQPHCNSSFVAIV